MKVFIGVPSDGTMEHISFESIYNLTIPSDVETEFYIETGQYVDETRNLVVERMLDTDADYLFFVDSDIVLPPDALIKLLSHDKDVIVGMYRARQNQQKIEIYNDKIKIIPDEVLKENALLEIGGAGLGCALIKREVFEKLKYPWFFYRQSPEFARGLSEDNWFCIQARQAGIKIYADTTVRCRHVGNIQWEIQL